ncbi:hypothetical protein NDU88_001840 [Pleurodeles waltl]|uniref:Uncharacterized protein n=1 Tax=Pleurodeles waltl TaxID=8319 RepID=A0AAV7P8A2_PLEWA|nr:hypothetical protein NDU88_001840 [Pleurodeles waltl]
MASWWQLWQKQPRCLCPHSARCHGPRRLQPPCLRLQAPAVLIRAGLINAEAGRRLRDSCSGGALLLPVRGDQASREGVQQGRGAGGGRWAQDAASKAALADASQLFSVLPYSETAAAEITRGSLGGAGSGGPAALLTFHHCHVQQMPGPVPAPLRNVPVLFYEGSPDLYISPHASQTGMHVV